MALPFRRTPVDRWRRNGRQKAPARALQRPLWLQGPQALLRLAADEGETGHPRTWEPPPSCSVFTWEKLQACSGEVGGHHVPRRASAGTDTPASMHPGRRHRRALSSWPSLPKPITTIHPTRGDSKPKLRDNFTKMPDQRFPTWVQVTGDW